MLFEDDVVVVVVEQDGDGAELGGGAAGFGDLVGLQDVDLPEQRETLYTWMLCDQRALDSQALYQPVPLRPRGFGQSINMTYKQCSKLPIEVHVLCRLWGFSVSVDLYSPGTP